MRHNFCGRSASFPTSSSQWPQPSSVKLFSQRRWGYLVWVIAQVLCFFSSEAPTWAQLKCNSWNLKLMLGKILRKQRIPVCILQRNSWPFTNMPLCFPAPALLTSQTGNCIFPVAADHVLGTGRAGLSPHLPLLAVPWDHGTALLASLEFLLFFSNSYFKRLLPPHRPNKGIVLCMYLFLFSSCISG